MQINEQHYMYRLSYYLVMEEKFNALHINNDRNEVWLEKNNRKRTDIIRLIHQGFPWKNHLKSDIAGVFQRVKMMKKMLTGQQVMIYNVYVTDLEPVDDWSSLKKTMILKEKKPMKMKLFYLAEGSLAEEEERLFETMHVKPMPRHELPDEYNQKKDIAFYKSALNQMVQQRAKQVQDTLTFGKPRMTHVLLLLNLFIFMVLEFNGGSTNPEVLVQYGANYPPAVAAGEWWRLVTSMFLHIGFLHLFLNMLALYYVGAVAERIYGSIRFTVIYFIAGTGGSLASFAFSPNISAGASGALFGLFGALLFFGVMYKQLFLQTMGKAVAVILILNLAVGLAVPQIDMGAHLGGLIFGFLASAMVFVPKRHHLGWQFAGLFLSIILAVFLVSYGG